MPSFVFESSSFYCTTGVNFLFLTSPIYMLTPDMDEVLDTLADIAQEENQESDEDDDMSSAVNESGLLC